MARRRSGFWTGLATGLGLGLAGLVAWAALVPLSTEPPALDGARLDPPPLPDDPGRALRPERPAGVEPGGLAGGAPRPLIAVPSVPAAPEDLPMRAGPAVDPFAGAPAGSPSLLPEAAEQP